MRLKVDEEADALHLQLVDVPVEESEEVAPGVIVDYDKSNQVVGIEVLYLSKRPYPVNLMDFPVRDSTQETCFNQLGWWSFDEPSRQCHRRPSEPRPPQRHSLEILDRVTRSSSRRRVPTLPRRWLRSKASSRLSPTSNASFLRSALPSPPASARPG